jgi:hypothetical protein
VAKVAQKFDTGIFHFRRSLWVYACQTPSKMQSKVCKNVLFSILLASSSASFECIQVDAAQAATSHVPRCKPELASTITSFTAAQVINHSCQKGQQGTTQIQVSNFSELTTKKQDIKRISFISPDLVSDRDLSRLYKIASPDLSVSANCNEIYLCQNFVTSPSLDAQFQFNYPPSTLLTAQAEPQPSINPSGISQTNQPPQLEGQPSEFPTTSPAPAAPIEQLNVPKIEYTDRLDRLRQRLKKQQSPESNRNNELGTILAKPRPIEQLPIPDVKPPIVTKPNPIGYLLGRVSYFQTNNIFSSEVDPVQDGLVFSGLTLASAPLPLGSKTYLNAAIDGNLVRYVDQSRYNYNLVRFNVGIYQQLTPRMYGEIGWSNQQFFYANDGDFFSAGDRFLNENSVRLSLGRRDTLTPRLILDSFYELRLSLADPDSRNRVNNSLLFSLGYYFRQSLKVGLDYQFNLSNFTESSREDQYHRLIGNITYSISDYSNISVQGGYTLGSSSDRNIDFDGWFFSVNYGWELGRF